MHFAQDQPLQDNVVIFVQNLQQHLSNFWREIDFSLYSPFFPQLHDLAIFGRNRKAARKNWSISEKPAPKRKKEKTWLNYSKVWRPSRCRRHAGEVTKKNRFQATWPAAAAAQVEGWPRHTMRYPASSAAAEAGWREGAKIKDVYMDRIDHRSEQQQTPFETSFRGTYGDLLTAMWFVLFFFIIFIFAETLFFKRKMGEYAFHGPQPKLVWVERVFKYGLQNLAFFVLISYFSKLHCIEFVSSSKLQIFLRTSQKKKLTHWKQILFFF